MKIDRLDAHDRYLQLLNQSFNISQNCQSLIDQRPFGDYPFYIFAHKRTIDVDERRSIFSQDILHTWQNPGYERKYKTLGDVPTHRLVWQPRLTRPKSQTNSMLFKAYPQNETIKVIWILPERAMWGQYEKGNITESNIVAYSIHQFVNNRSALDISDPDDLDDDAIDKIYKDICMDANRKKWKLGQVNEIFGKMI
jgi:hypothetical protein